MEELREVSILFLLRFDEHMRERIMSKLFNVPSIFLFFALAITFVALGLSATFVVGIFIFLYVSFDKYATNYRSDEYQRDIATVAGVFKTDFRMLFYKFFSKKCNKLYFFRAIPLIVLYILIVAALPGISPELFSFFVRSNERFISLLSFFFPTIDVHYDALKVENESWGEALRQIYAVSFSSAIILCFSFYPQIKLFSNIALHSLLKQKKTSEKFFRIPIAAFLLLVITISFILIMANSLASGGSGEFIFGKYGEHDVVQNNHYFLTLWISALIPLAHAYTLMLIVAQYKFYTRRNDNV